MFKYFNFMLVLVLIIGIAPNRVVAEGDSPRHTDAVTQATPKLDHDEVVVTGKVICLGCHLKKEKQAKAECSIYGHANALVIEKSYDAKGGSIEIAKNKIYQFLPNDHSDKLIKDHDFVGKIIVITGKIYPEANVLEVDFFKQKNEGGKE